MTDEWTTYNFRWNDKFFFATFPLNLVGRSNGKVYTYGTSQDADGIALASFVLFGRRALGDGRQRGLLKRIYPFVVPFSTPLDITVHLADHAQGVATINQTVSFNQSLPEGGHFSSIFRRGRYMEIEFGTDGPGQPWELSGYDVDTVTGGLR